MLLSAAAAQSPSLEGKRIVEIQYSPAQVLHPADLEQAQPLKNGQSLRAEDVAEAIDRLFATGRFEDISVEAEPSGDGVMIRFVTTPTWFVRGVSVEGKVTQPPNRGEITSTTQLSLGTPFHDSDMTRAVDRIKRLFSANGRYEAEVTPEIERDDKAHHVFLRFQMKEGKRAKYDMPVIRGETKLPESTIVRSTGWRIRWIKWWREVTDARTRKGIQGIVSKYQKQDRLMARVELEKLDYDPVRRRVRPTLNINAGPRVKVRAVEAKVSKRVMKRYVPIFQERRVDNDLLVEGARNLRDYFQSKGYYDVDVDFRMLPPENDLQTIEYVISQGQRYKLKRVEVKGNKYFDEETIRERMFLQPASFNLRRGRYSEAFRKRDERNIANLYHANGFRDVKVASVVDRNYQGTAAKIAATMQIEEGPQWIVDSLTVNGVTQLPREELTAGLASVIGQPFAEVNIAADRSYILTHYHSQGFAEADFKAPGRRAMSPIT